MGVGRQSFHATFGDKRRCYLDALATYMADEVAAQLNVLQASLSPVTGLRGYLYSVVDWPGDRRAVGCMAMNALCEFGMSDTEIATVMAHGASRLEATLVALIEQAKTLGEVLPATDAAQAARSLMCTRAGMVVGAKSGSAPNILAGIADFTIDHLLTAGGRASLAGTAAPFEDHDQ